MKTGGQRQSSLPITLLTAINLRSKIASEQSLHLHTFLLFKSLDEPWTASADTCDAATCAAADTFAAHTCEKVVAEEELTAALPIWFLSICVSNEHIVHVHFWLVYQTPQHHLVAPKLRKGIWGAGVVDD